MSAGQEERLHQTLAILAPWCWTSSIQNCEKINFYCLSHTVYFVMAAQADWDTLGLYSQILHTHVSGVYISLHFSTHTPTPQVNSEQSLFFCIVCSCDIDLSCCLALLLREAAYLNRKGGATKIESTWLYILSQATHMYSLLESRRQASDFPPPAVATFSRGDNCSWLAAQMRTRSRGDRRN